MPELSKRVGEFTDSVIRRMTRISDATPGSINLSQGFPDFDPPQVLLDALREMAGGGEQHQYSVTYGSENLRRCIAEKYSPIHGYEIDPETQVVVTCGGTEAMMAAMMTVCSPPLRIRNWAKRSSKAITTAVCPVSTADTHQGSFPSGGTCCPGP